MANQIHLSLEELEKLGLVNTEFSEQELNNLNVIRISYNTDEIRLRGIAVNEEEVITSFDSAAQKAKELLRVEVAEKLSEGVTKWQLPIPKGAHQEVVQRTNFAPNTEIAPHSHPHRGESAAFRIIIKGSIIFRENEYKTGDWFYIPPKTKYSFKAGAEGAEILHTYHAPCPRFEIDPMSKKKN